MITVQYRIEPRSDSQNVDVYFWSTDAPGIQYQLRDVALGSIKLACESLIMARRAAGLPVPYSSSSVPSQIILDV